METQKDTVIISLERYEKFKQSENELERLKKEIYAKIDANKTIGYCIRGSIVKIMDESEVTRTLHQNMKDCMNDMKKLYDVRDELHMKITRLSDEITKVKGFNFFQFVKWRKSKKL